MRTTNTIEEHQAIYNKADWTIDELNYLCLTSFYFNSERNKGASVSRSESDRLIQSEYNYDSGVTSWSVFQGWVKDGGSFAAQSKPFSILNEAIEWSILNPHTN